MDWQVQWDFGAGNFPPYLAQWADRGLKSRRRNAECTETRLRKTQRKWARSLKPRKSLTPPNVLPVFGKGGVEVCEGMYSAFINCQLRVTVDSAVLAWRSFGKLLKDRRYRQRARPAARPPPGCSGASRETSRALSQRRLPTRGLQPHLNACFFVVFFKTMPPDAPFNTGAGVFVSLPLFVCLCQRSRPF